MKKLLTLIIGLLVLGTFTEAQIAKTITYQGVLKDASGARVTGTVDLDLNIYAASGGGSLYADGHAGVSVDNGLFSVVIGTGSGGAISLPFNEAYELGITVDSGTELAPRTSLTASPYALNAGGVNISGGSNGDVLTNDGNGNGAWTSPGAGPQGPQGKAGADGATGAAGAAGAAGAQGDPGPVGSEFWDGDIAGNINSANTGNVGIGTSTPDGKLHVAGLIRANSHMVIPDDYEFIWSGTGTSIGGRAHRIYFQVGSGIPMQIMSDKRVLIGAADGGAADAVNPIRLQVHGRGMLGALGIGKGDGDALNAKLDVTGDAFIGEASDGVKLDVLGHNGVVLRVNGYDNASCVFGRADGLGTASIGTQNLNLAGISYRLMVHSSHVKRTLGLSADAGVETGIHLLDGGTERWRIYSDNDVASGEAGHKKLIFAKGDGTDLFSFTQGGDLTLRNLTQTSDERLKQNIQTVPAALDKVMQLRGVTFDWRNGPDSGLGVVAQEVEAVVPEMVHTAEDGYKSVRYSQISALLIEAMKEQQAHIEALEATVESLKANN